MGATPLAEDKPKIAFYGAMMAIQRLQRASEGDRAAVKAMNAMSERRAGGWQRRGERAARRQSGRARGGRLVG